MQCLLPTPNRSLILSVRGLVQFEISNSDQTTLVPLYDNVLIPTFYIKLEMNTEKLKANGQILYVSFCFHFSNVSFQFHSVQCSIIKSLDIDQLSP